MKRFTIPIVTLALFACNDQASPPGSLSQAGGGGGCPQVACPPGYLCNVNTHQCYQVRPLSCSDQVRNNDETDVDCGGSCAKCPVGKSCLVAADCTITSCVNGICQATNCIDGVLNGSETDVDCGGANCPNRCGDGSKCLQNTDCINMVCGQTCNSGMLCLPPSCSDGIQNNDETDVDCGGSCAKCAKYMHCAVDCDCSAVGCEFDGIHPPHGSCGKFEECTCTW